MKLNKNLLSIFLIIAAAAVIIAFEAVNFSFTSDIYADKLLKRLVPQLTAGLLLLTAAIVSGYVKTFIPARKDLPKNILWCVPCFFVAAANFPFSALISGTAEIVRPDLVWLFAVMCLGIGLLEEIIFRAMLFGVISEMLKDRRHRTISAIAISSAVFALMHLVNIFSGAGVGETLLQVGYCFLTGAMLAAVYVRTNNIWLCVFIHSAFDFGGMLLYYLGTGEPQDTCFWILTAIAAVICAVHVIYYLIKTDKKERQNED